MSLSEIKSTIENFRTVECGLYHETVTTDEQGPKKKVIAEEEIFERVSLCKNEDRRVRLGCAHSMANSEFDRILGSTQLQQPEIQELRKEFNRICMEIYRLDHKMGDLQKEYAQFLDVGEEGSIKFNGIEKEIKEARDAHGKFIRELTKIRDKVLVQIDEIMNC